VIKLLSASLVARCDSVLPCRRVRREYVSSLRRSGTPNQLPENQWIQPFRPVSVAHLYLRQWGYVLQFVCLSVSRITQKVGVELLGNFFDGWVVSLATNHLNFGANQDYDPDPGILTEFIPTLIYYLHQSNCKTSASNFKNNDYQA